MITKEMLLDAVGRLIADMADGTWGLSDDCMHPAIVELYDHLPAVPEPGATRPLMTEVVPSKLERYIGYRMNVTGVEGSQTVKLLTIADVVPGLYSTGRRVTFAEYPGYHLDVSGEVKVYAVVEPTKPTEPDTDAHPDLIDRDNDTWRWYGGYSLNDPDLCERTDIERAHGPVRDA